MKKGNKIRYAVVGLGYISQAAILPAFENANKNSTLVALVSEDPKKLKNLSKKYNAPLSFSYEEYEECLHSGEIDAVYIALPNHLHYEFACRAADAGIHVLCEKPMALNERECLDMIEAAEKNNVKLMIAYRLHFEKANLQALEIAQSGKLGNLRIFNSVFSMQVEPNNIRLKQETGGGVLYDIGIYCINAARMLFEEEPTEVYALNANNGEKRFSEVDEMISAVLYFSKDRLASLTCSFGAHKVSFYQLIGTKGNLRVDPAYEWADDLKHILTIDKQTKIKTFAKRDQFAPELVYFSDCILKNKSPEPSGEEGLADLRVIRALQKSIKLNKPIFLSEFEKEKPISSTQEMRFASAGKVQLIHAKSPSRS